jgi:hypothetical protein
MKKPLLVFFAVLFPLTTARVHTATTINAASCAVADLRSAAARVVAGDTLEIPAGTCTQTESWEWSPPSNVTIRMNQTVIIDDMDRRGFDAGLWNIGTSADGGFRMTGGTFKGSGNTNAITYNGVIRISGQTKSLRLDHLKIENLPYFALMINGHMYGVIDHSVFDLAGGSAIKFNGYNEGDTAWSEPTELGSNKFVFIEDNAFRCLPRSGSVQDSYLGSRWVARYNKLENCGFQTHPTGGSGRARGTRAFEIYKNEVTATGNNFNFFFLSSGTGVVWGNTVPALFDFFVTLHSMRFDSKTYQQTPTPNGWGYYRSNFDVDGFAMDQPGQGQGDLLEGAFPNVRNVATGCDATKPCVNPRQKLEPVAIFENTYLGGNLTFVYEPDVLKLDRDFVLTRPVSYTPYIYPHPLNTDGPIPPQPTPNIAPEITLLQIKNGSTALDPTAPITIKKVTIATAARDDTGISWLEISARLSSSTQAQVLKAAAPEANPTTMTVSWTTQPYKGKGDVILEVTARDADGLITKKSVTVRVAR